MSLSILCLAGSGRSWTLKSQSQNDQISSQPPHPQNWLHWTKGIPVDAMIVSAATKKELAEQSTHVYPPNRESRGMDRFGKCIYSSTTFSLRELNYLAHFTQLQRELVKELSNSQVETISVEDFEKVSPHWLLLPACLIHP